VFEEEIAELKTTKKAIIQKVNITNTSENDDTVEKNLYLIEEDKETYFGIIYEIHAKLKEMGWQELLYDVHTHTIDPHRFVKVIKGKKKIFQTPALDDGFGLIIKDNDYDGKILDFSEYFKLKTQERKEAEQKEREKQEKMKKLALEAKAKIRKKLIENEKLATLGDVCNG